MGLVSITNIENGEDADASVFNTRYAAILAALNGNIEAANIKDSTITYGKFSLADRDIPHTKIGLTPTVTTNSGTAGGSLNYIQIGTYLHYWGTATSQTVGAGAASNLTVILPVAFAVAPTISFAGVYNSTSRFTVAVTNGTLTTTGFSIYIYNFDSVSGTASVNWQATGKAAA